MTDRLQKLRELYEETPTGVGDSGGEVESLREMKELLDRRPRKRPDPAVVSSILAAASGDAVPTAKQGHRLDRPPVARQKSTALRVGAASALVVLLLAVVGILHLDFLERTAVEPLADAQRPAEEAAGTVPDASDQEYSASAAQDREGSATTAGQPSRSAGRASERNFLSESTARSVEIGDEVTVRAPTYEDAIAGFVDARGTSGGLATASGAADDAASTARRAEIAAMSWDQRDDVIDLYQDIEMIGGGMDQGWEPPSMPLEMLPQQHSGRERYVQPAGTHRSPDN